MVLRTAELVVQMMRISRFDIMLSRSTYLINAWLPFRTWSTTFLSKGLSGIVMFSRIGNVGAMVRGVALCKRTRRKKRRCSLWTYISLGS